MVSMRPFTVACMLSNLLKIKSSILAWPSSVMRCTSWRVRISPGACRKRPGLFTDRGASLEMPTLLSAWDLNQSARLEALANISLPEMSGFKLLGWGVGWGVYRPVPPPREGLARLRMATSINFSFSLTMIEALASSRASNSFS